MQFEVGQGLSAVFANFVIAGQITLAKVPAIGNLQEAVKETITAAGFNPSATATAPTSAPTTTAGTSTFNFVTK